MKTLKDYFDSEMLTWLRDNDLEYKLPNLKLDKGELNVLYNDKFCLKLYDRMGHGFGATINVADKYDESIYDNDRFSLYWAFRYFKITETANFVNRDRNRYEQELPNLIEDLKAIIPRLNKMSSVQWTNMMDWIKVEARKQFT
jgi:hypothetical protein